MIAALDRVAQRQLQHEDRYSELIDRLVAGDEIDPSEIEGILSGAKKSLAELRKAVEVRQQRAKQRAEFTKLPQLQSRVAEINNAVDAAKREFGLAQQKLLATCQPIETERRDLLAEIARLSQIPVQLAQTCPSQELRSKHDYFQAQAQELDRRIQQASDNAERLQAAGGDNTGAVQRARQAVDDLRAQQREANEGRDATWKAMQDF